jgi:hypothetical protein
MRRQTFEGPAWSWTRMRTSVRCVHGVESAGHGTPVYGTSAEGVGVRAIAEFEREGDCDTDTRAVWLRWQHKAELDAASSGFIAGRAVDRV